MVHVEKTTLHQHVKVKLFLHLENHKSKHVCPKVVRLILMIVWRHN